MGVGATNRIINPQAIIGQQIKDYRRLKTAKSYAKKRWINEHKRGYIRCTKCDGAMRSDIGRIQIENKRENAPICVACIINIPRKIKSVV